MLGVPIFCGWLTSCLATSYNATYLATEKRKGRDNYSHGASAGLQQFGGPRNMGRFLKMTSQSGNSQVKINRLPINQPSTSNRSKALFSTLAVSCRHGDRKRKRSPGCENNGASSPSCELASFSCSNFHLRRRLPGSSNRQPTTTCRIQPRNRADLNHGMYRQPAESRLIADVDVLLRNQHAEKKLQGTTCMGH